MDQNDYRSRYSELEERFGSAKNRLEELNEEKLTRMGEAEEIRRFADILRTERTAGLAFTEDLWSGLIDRARCIRTAGWYSSSKTERRSP